VFPNLPGIRAIGIPAIVALAVVGVPADFGVPDSVSSLLLLV
jgi:hypothetical protein